VPTEVAALIAITLYVTAVLLLKLPVEKCSKCQHCAEEKRLKKLAEEKRTREYARSVGIYRDNECPQCDHCNKREKADG
jgi:hypothetical protein